MKRYILSIIFLFTISIITFAQNNNQMNLYDFKVLDIDQKEFDLSILKGKKVMIVNVASKCGLTPQYAELQELYETYKDIGFEIVGFPANNFNNQEPGENSAIKEFCSAEYSVTFPLMSKISVVGPDKAPIYEWLTDKDKNGITDQEVSWNFQKYLIDRNGNLEAVVQPKTTPMSKEVLEWLKSEE